MIVLDTNVISEAIRVSPSEIVRRWFSIQKRSELCTTAITEAELLLGIELMPNSKARFEAERSAARILGNVLGGRVLPFNREAAHVFAILMAERRRAGHSLQDADVQIAAIARSNGADIATRNVRDFQHCGVEIINPWSD